MEVEYVPERFLEGVYESDLERRAALHRCFRGIAKTKDLELVRDVVDDATKFTDGDNLESETVARNYLYLLQYLCKDRKSLNSHVPVLRVLQLLRNFKGDLEIVTRGSSCLVAGCTEEKPRALALNHGCIEFVATLFTDYSSDKKVLENCLALLANVCHGSKTAKSLAAQTGCVRAVHSLVDSEDIGIAYSSCVAIRNLSASEVANSRTLIELGAVGSLLAAIRRFKERKTRYQALCALQNMAQTNRDVYKQILGEESVVDIVVDILGAESKFPGVQLNCLQILHSFAQRDESACQRVGRIGGVKLIINALRRSKDIPEVANSALLTLRFILFEAANRDDMDQFQGMDAVADCFNHYLSGIGSESRAVVELIINNCMRVLSNATIDNLPNKNAAAINGTVKMVVEAMTIFLESKDVQEQGSRCLRNMADRCDLNRHVQIESGVIERLVLSFLGYPENLIVLEHGIACLVNLANAEPAVQRIKDINVIDSVGRALNDYPKHLEIQSQGQALISRINIFSKPEQEENFVAEKGSVLQKFPRGIFGKKRIG
uniref:Vacuolar protein 8 n=1 Tax=Rhodosorus marinus TaxID=101924 RepID=A0A7S0G2U2_9RHOD|mmetsp:Transcript_23813/g.34217  ORF Transcript_23813/g.34217 Transcript_23813/m.34217 type:complete len:548 (+) Transcript_23813:592-2235(+)